MKRFAPTSFVNIIGAIIAIWIFVALVQTVKRNYELEKQIDIQRQKIALLQAQKEELTYNIAYYNTESFKQRQARARLGLQQPGESVIILPSASPAPTPSSDPAKERAKRSNLKQWIDFLSGRG